MIFIVYYGSTVLQEFTDRGKAHAFAMDYSEQHEVITTVEDTLTGERRNYREFSIFF